MDVSVTTSVSVLNMTNISDVTAINTSCVENYSAMVYINGSVDCELSHQKFLVDNRLTFDTGQLIRVVGTFIIFLLSCAGNFPVLACVTVWRRAPQMSHTQVIILHLCLANICFTFFILPMDAVWNYTIEWYGGDAMCRIMNMLKQFAMYISSSVVVVMGVDKVLGLISPCSPGQQMKRIKVLLIWSWVFSTANSIPASVIFSVKEGHRIFECECDNYYILQCVDMHVIGKTGRTIFFFYTMCISFFIPMFAIIVCYVIIMATIAKMAKRAKVTEKRSAGFRPKSNRKSLARQSLERARKMWQIVTALITLSFLVCWGPYYFAGVVFWLIPDLTFNQYAMMYMLMSSYLHPCFQPIIMVALMPEVRESLRCKKWFYSGDVRDTMSSRKVTGHTLLLASRTSPKIHSRGSPLSPRLTSRREEFLVSPIVSPERNGVEPKKPVVRDHV